MLGNLISLLLNIHFLFTIDFCDVNHDMNGVDHVETSFEDFCIFIIDDLARNIFDGDNQE